jgi:hypothetical protein
VAVATQDELVVGWLVCWEEALQKGEEPPPLDQLPSSLRRRAQEGIRLLRLFPEAKVGASFPSQPEEEHPPLRLDDFDDYQDIVYLDHGGMGVVYRAFDTSRKHPIAMKFPLPARHELWDHFIHEPQSIAQLDHPNIVRVYKVQQCPDRPYFTMKLVQGDKLDKYLQAQDHQPRVIAAMMVKVARAVHHAHQRGVLHRDLKPGNILLDGDEPVVTDFGLATEAILPTACRREGPDATGPYYSASRSFQGIVGTIGFMSPEQAKAEPPREVTTLSDVYGLGAVLYALLTGRPPFPVQGEDIQGALAKVRSPAQPDLPRSLNRRVDLNLQATCLKALDKDPARRYQSAEGLARDLERWLANEEIEARRLPLFHRERVRRWCRRNPGWAALAVAAVAMLILSAVLANVGAWHMESKAVEATGESNTRAAEMVADSFLWLMKDLSRNVVETAQSEEVRQLLRQTASAKTTKQLKTYLSGEGQQLNAWVQEQFTRCNIRLKGEGIPAFATFYFLNQDGRLVTYAALPGEEQMDQTGELFEGRDYFLVATDYGKQGLRGMDAVHVSRVFQSKTDGHFKFAISTPVLDADGSWLGVMSATLPNHRNYGLDDRLLHDSRQEVVLVGPVDRSIATSQDTLRLGYDYHVLLHDAFGDHTLRKRPVEFTLPPTSWPRREPRRPELVPRPAKSVEPVTRYQDPLGSEREKYVGYWVAGFAPVGNTDLVVIVQQRYDDAVGQQVAFAKRFIWSGWSALALACGLAAAVAGVRAARRRRQRALS